MQAGDLGRSGGYVLRPDDQRRVLAAASKAEPVRLSHIVQETGLADACVRGHVEQLVAEGRVWQAKIGAGRWVHCKPVAASRRVASPSRYALHVAKSQRVLKAIQDRPGIALRELARSVGLGPEHTSAYVRHLEGLHIVSRRTWQNRTTLWAGLVPGDWKRQLLFADPRLEELLRLVQTHKGASQSFILVHAKATWHWPRATTQYRLQQLQGAGVIRATPGRQRTYSVPRKQRLPISR